MNVNFKQELKSSPNSDTNLRSHVCGYHKMTEFGYASQVKIENFEIPLDKEKDKEIHKAL